MSQSRRMRRIGIVVIIALAAAAGLFFVLHRGSTLSCKGVGISRAIDGPEPAGSPSPEAAGISAANGGPMWPSSSPVPSDGWTFDAGRVTHDLPGGHVFRVDVRQTSTGGWVAAGSEETCVA